MEVHTVRNLVKWSDHEHHTMKWLAPMYLRNFEAYKQFLPGRSIVQIKSYYRNNHLEEYALKCQLKNSSKLENQRREQEECVAVLDAFSRML